MTTYTLGHFQSTDKMKELVNQVLDSGHLSYGELCSLAEQKLAMQHQCIYGVLSNSGTSSLLVALQTLKELHGWDDGDEVLVPSITFVATINVVIHCNLKPVLVDVNPVYYDMDITKIEEKITDRTCCIIVAHMFGQSADMPAIAGMAEYYNLKIIEDSCETMGVSIDSKRVGSWGEIGCFSTYVAHIITSGVGGMSTTNNPDYESHMRSLVNHGIVTKSLPSGTKFDPTFIGREFVFDKIGHSFRVTEMEAALLLPQIEDLYRIIHQRQANARRLHKFFSQFEERFVLPKVRPNSEHSWMVYPIMLRRDKAEGFIKYLRSRKVEVRTMMPITTQPCYKFLPFLYPVAKKINEQGFYIGCHQYLTDEQFDHLFSSVDLWMSNKVDSHFSDVDFNMKG